MVRVSPARPLLRFLFGSLLVGKIALGTAPAGPPTTSLVPTKGVLASQPPDVAAPKLGPDGQANPSFLAAHRNFVAAAARGNIDLLFLGDSITAGWGDAKDIWEASFGSHRPANFGIGGDRTQHLLWRCENGELDGIAPKAAVVMIGTNNSGSDTADGIAAGIGKIIATLRTKLPATKVLLLAVFPRGEKAEKNKKRELLAQVNSSIAKLDDGEHVFFQDVGPTFLAPDGSFKPEYTKDFVHLTPAGYQAWAEAMGPKLSQLLK